ncbi:MAG: hypothetical protein GW900_06205 [Gammaproteobacteria bacterium]|nr:hypothetical protein [Gammaproteobacteria bacterium]
MKFLLPVVSVILGIKLIIDPMLRSAKYGTVFDFSGFNYYIGGFFLIFGVIMLAEVLKKRR